MVRMSIFKKALKILVSVFTTVLLVLLALVVYGKASTIFGNNSYPTYFGYTFFRIASGSMEPALYKEDVILVKITDDVKEKDIISYAKNKEIITHRVIKIDSTGLTVQGDNNTIPDETIQKDQIIGKVVKVFKKLAVWQKVVTEPKILITMFITFLLFDFALSYKGKEEEKDKPVVNKEKINSIKDKVLSFFENIKDKIIDIVDNIKDKIKPKKEETPPSKEEEEKKEKLIEKEINEIKLDLPKEEKVEIVDLPVKVKEVKEEKLSEQKENLLEATTILDFEELRKHLEEEKRKNKDPFGYTIRLDLNEINKKIKDKVK